MKSAFENLYETYYCKVYRYLLKLVGYEENLAEELTQECFYQVFIAQKLIRKQSFVIVVDYWGLNGYQ